MASKKLLGSNVEHVDGFGDQAGGFGVRGSGGMISQHELRYVVRLPGLVVARPPLPPEKCCLCNTLIVFLVGEG